MRLQSCLACAALMAWPALAVGQCPTATDLQTGVRLSTDTPHFSALYSMLPNGHLQVQRLNEGGATIMTTSTPHPLTKISSTTNAPSFVTTSTDDIDHLDEVLQWSSSVENMVGGTRIPSGTVNVTFLDHSDVTIADCTHDTWRVEVTNAPRLLPQTTSVNHYAPTLGLIIAIQIMDDTGRMASALTFDRIEAVQ